MVYNFDKPPNRKNLHFKFFNGFEMYYGEAKICIQSRKSMAILAYILLNGARSQSREHIASIFWSGSDEERARASLRQSLKQLKDILKKNGVCHFIEAQRSEIVVSTKNMDIDLWQITDQIRSGSIPDILTSELLTSEKILKGFDDIDHEFYSWLTIYRQNWHKRIVEHFEKIVYTTVAYSSLQIKACEALVCIDPTHEKAHRILMECYAREGNIAKSLSQYETLCKLLQNEYETEPSEETQNLIARIKAGRLEDSGQACLLSVGSSEKSAPPAQKEGQNTLNPSNGNTSGSHSGMPLPVLEVVFKENAMAFGATTCPVSLSFRSEMIGCLARFREWVVVEVSENTIGRSDYSLTLDFSKDALKINLHIVLIKTGIERILCSETFSFSIDKWEEKKKEAGEKVAARVDTYISSDGLTRQIFSLSAAAPYTKWLISQFLRNNWSCSSTTQAKYLLKEAIEEWPEFSPPYSGLSHLYSLWHIVFPGVFRTREREERALSLAEKAAELDPLDARAHRAIALVCLFLKKYEQSHSKAEIALSLNPGNANLVISLAAIFAYLGDTTYALELAERALSLNKIVPPHYWIHLTEIYFLAKKYEPALRALSCASHSAACVPGWEAILFSLLGYNEKALISARRFLVMSRQNWHSTQGAPEKAPPDDEIVNWFTSAFPFRYNEQHSKFKNSLIKACDIKKQVLTVSYFELSREGARQTKRRG